MKGMVSGSTAAVGGVAGDSSILYIPGVAEYGWVLVYCTILPAALIAGCSAEEHSCSVLPAGIASPSLFQPLFCHDNTVLCHCNTVFGHCNNLSVELCFFALSVLKYSLHLSVILVFLWNSAMRSATF